MSLIFEPCSNCTTFIQKLLYADSLTDVGQGGMLGLIFLIVIGSVLFLMMKGWEFEKGFATSMFITSFLGILLSIMGLVSNKIIYLFIILLVVSVFLLFKSNDSSAGY